MLMEFIRGQATPFSFLIFVISALIAITIHEFAHAVRAHQAGDPTPGRQGRLTLNPLAHYDPIGTTMILIMGMGWGRAVMTRPETHRHPRRDGLMISLWGPLSNILLGITVLLIYRFVPIHWGPWEGTPETRGLAEMLIYWNLFLAFFNLIPITPLDGSKVLSFLLPVKQAVPYERFMAQYGMLLLLLLVFSGAPIIDKWVGLPTQLIINTVLYWHPTL